jgi:hypothetical protein
MNLRIADCRRRLVPLIVACWLPLACGPIESQAEDLILVARGQPVATIHAPGENDSAGLRLARRLERLTGAKLDVHTGDLPPQASVPLITIGSPESNLVVREIVRGDERIAALGDEGYLLQTARWRDREILVAAGNSLAGANHAVSELVSWKLKLSDGSAAADGSLNEVDKPALRYRLVWTWDGHCNWASTVDETMALYVNGNPAVGSMAVPYTPDGFRTHFTRAIDYLSDHKLNGLIVWGFLRDEHGGVEMGREISRYAKQNNVRILPGVCSQGGYGGFIFSRSNRFNLEVWCQQHPELQARSAQGEFVPGMLNPLRPENQQWLREGAEWLFTNLPDIGGINLENGDFMSCQCGECRAERARPENDPNCFWDMMTSQKPILDVAQRMRPDGWMTFASYVGFTAERVRVVGPATYPPKFLQQMPGNAICQWTLSGMTTPESWPNGARPPDSNFRDGIGLLHHGSVWGTPLDPARWWAAPGAWNDDYSALLPFVCGRIAQAQLGGIVITGQNGDQCPAHELNYVALEYFSWHPDRSYEQFSRDRLAPCYGGPDRAAQFLKLLHGTSRAPAEIRADQQTASSIGESPQLDQRQRTRWKNLAGELARREKLAVSLAEGKDRK